MKTRFLLPLLLATVTVLLITVPRADAGYIVTLRQQGHNVFGDGMGALDLTGLSHQTTGLLAPELFPDDGFILLGSGRGGQVDLYSGVSGPTSFGPGGPAGGDGGGDLVGINGVGSSQLPELLLVPAGYVSGTSLLSSDVFGFNATLKELGVNPGTYEWTWGDGPDQNFTLVVQNVPDSAPSIGLLLLSLTALLVCPRKGCLTDS